LSLSVLIALALRRTVIQVLSFFWPRTGSDESV